MTEMDQAQVTALIAKATAIAAGIVAATSSLLAQISNSAATASGAAIFAGLTLSSFTLIRFLVARSTTDEGRSTEMWADLRTERDGARERSSNAYRKVEAIRLELAAERARRVHWENVAAQLRTEYRIRIGEEPASWQDLEQG